MTEFKEKELGELINQLTEIARKYKDTQQLREQIGTVLKDSDIVHFLFRYQRENKMHGKHIRELTETINVFETTHFTKFGEDECWFYQGNGDDYLRSLICPVVISAKDLIDIEEAAGITPIYTTETDNIRERLINKGARFHIWTKLPNPHVSYDGAVVTEENFFLIAKRLSEKYLKNEYETELLALLKEDAKFTTRAQFFTNRR